MGRPLGRPIPTSFPCSIATAGAQRFRTKLAATRRRAGSVFLQTNQLMTGQMAGPDDHLTARRDHREQGLCNPWRRVANNRAQLLYVEEVTPVETCPLKRRDAALRFARSEGFEPPTF